MLGGDLSFLYSDATRFSRNPDDLNSDDYNVIGGRDNLESYRQEGMGAINEKLMIVFFSFFNVQMAVCIFDCATISGRTASSSLNPATRSTYQTLSLQLKVLGS